jgi:hypothetical protein
MISKSNCLSIAAAAAFLCATSAFARENHGTPRGPRVRPTPSGYAPATFLTPPGSNTA